MTESRPHMLDYASPPVGEKPRPGEGALLLQLIGATMLMVVGLTFAFGGAFFLLVGAIETQAEQAVVGTLMLLAASLCLGIGTFAANRASAALRRHYPRP